MKANLTNSAPLKAALKETESLNAQIGEDSGGVNLSVAKAYTDTRIDEERVISDAKYVHNGHAISGGLIDQLTA
jgi:hypothetical protein